MSKTTKSAKIEEPIPTKLFDLFKELEIPVTTDRYSKTQFITVTDKLKNEIPFDVMSDSFKTAQSRKNTQTDRINITEMINTMMTKKKITSTTKSNMYRCIPFFEAIGKLKVNENYEVYNDRGLFRPEDKFTYRLREHLKIIFPGIENKIVTQKPVSTIRRTFIVDICINISDNNVIGIEFDEAHHFERDKEVSDNLKRTLLSRLIELRIFKYNIDRFDHFLRSLCYDIIKYHDSSDMRDLRRDYICNFISYNISKMDNVDMRPEGIRQQIDVIDTNDTIDIDALSEWLLNSDCDKVKDTIKKYLKCGLMIKNKVSFNKNGDLVNIHVSELLKFLMLYDDNASNNNRAIFARVIQEYIAILTGNYDIYKYICSAEQFIAAMEDEALAYSMTYQPKITNKLDIDSDSNENVSEDDNIIKPTSKAIITPNKANKSVKIIKPTMNNTSNSNTKRVNKSVKKPINNSKSNKLRKDNSSSHNDTDSECTEEDIDDI